jgi:heterodisulfide reductase subunit B2
LDFAYFPGCAGHGTARDQDLSTRSVLSALGITFDELPDWSCCGATPGHTIGGDVGLVLSLRNLRIASDTKRPLLVPCASCFGNLKRAEQAVKTGTTPDDAEDVPAASECTTVTSIVTALSQPEILLRIKEKQTRDLSALRLVAYYGCLLVRPLETTGAADSENPTGMETVVAACGAANIDWPHKTDCCGGPHTISHPDLVTLLSSRLVDRARRFGANAIVTACPMCHGSLDSVQWELRRQNATFEPLPIFYLSELVGASLGLKRQRSWLKRHLIDPRPLLKESGVLT